MEVRLPYYDIQPRRIARRA